MLMGLTYEKAQRLIRQHRGCTKRTATALILACIMREHGYTCTPVRNPPDTLELPLLIKKCNYGSAHCYVWSPSQKRVFDPSGYNDNADYDSIPPWLKTAIERSDEPAYVVNHPRFKKWLKEREAQQNGAAAYALAA